MVFVLDRNKLLRLSLSAAALLANLALAAGVLWQGWNGPGTYVLLLALAVGCVVFHPGLQGRGQGPCRHRRALAVAQGCLLLFFLGQVALILLELHTPVVPAEGLVLFARASWAVLLLAAGGCVAAGHLVHRAFLVPYVIILAGCVAAKAALYPLCSMDMTPALLAESWGPLSLQLGAALLLGTLGVLALKKQAPAA